VKLRPCRRFQLAEIWLGAEKGEGWKVRVELDWAGSHETAWPREASEPPVRYPSSPHPCGLVPPASLAGGPTAVRSERQAGHMRLLEHGRWDHAGKLMRKLLGGRGGRDPVPSRRCMLVSGRWAGPTSLLQLQYRYLTTEMELAPLAQSVERIHGKEKPGAILLVR
jgi:hypothetical protein